MAENSKGVWFLLGVSVGALAALLYAPQSGEQTRELLRSKAGEGRERMMNKSTDWRDQASRLREQAGGMADRGRQAVTRQIDQFQAAVEAGRQAYRDAAGLDHKPEEEAASQL